MVNCDPIAAIATSSGRGGVGIIRVSGSDLSPLIEKLFQRKLSPRYAYHLPFLSSEGDLIDNGIVIFFQSPNSYTGEDVLELHGHGNPFILREILNLCISSENGLGIRVADPGEFTQRAFLNGRIDLTQAEAIGDLIESSSKAAARCAINSLSGIFSLEINNLSSKLLSLRKFIEANLEFPEEISSSEEIDQIYVKLKSLVSEFDELITKSKQGMVLRDGLKVVLVGQPNVGKSSLFNYLSGDEIAIVTSIPGTTRDKITQEIYLNNMLLSFSDTAGIHETKNLIEKIGIERTWKEIKHADVILHIMDITKSPNKFDEKIALSFPKSTPVLRVFNKLDLLGTSCISEGIEGEVQISVLDNIGLNFLHDWLLNIVQSNSELESQWLARKRHVNSLEDARDSICSAIELILKQPNSYELLSEELRRANESLAFITGKVTNEKLLGEIFSSFCIGK